MKNMIFWENQDFVQSMILIAKIKRYDTMITAHKHQPSGKPLFLKKSQKLRNFFIFSSKKFALLANFGQFF